VAAIKIQRGGSSAARERWGKRFRSSRHGDVMLMVLLVREEKGWNFGLTRNRTAAGSQITGAAF
jgi:hypothetical protein